jgi:hypothetical protein
MPSDIYDNLLAWVFDPVAGQGHYLEEAGERRSSWRDWENN